MQKMVKYPVVWIHLVLVHSPISASMDRVVMKEYTIPRDLTNQPRNHHQVGHHLHLNLEKILTERKMDNEGDADLVVEARKKSPMVGVEMIVKIKMDEGDVDLVAVPRKKSQAVVIAVLDLQLMLRVKMMTGVGHYLPEVRQLHRKRQVVESFLHQVEVKRVPPFRLRHGHRPQEGIVVDPLQVVGVGL